MPKFKEVIWGKNDKLKKADLMSPEQKEIFKYLMEHPIEDKGMYERAKGFFKDYFDQGPMNFIEEMDPSVFEEPLMQQYEQEFIPQLAERFSGMGSGSRHSSGFTQAGAQGAKNLAAQLGALRGNMKMQNQGMNLQALMSMLPQNLQYTQQPYSNYFQMLGIPQFAPYVKGGTTGLIPGMAQGIANGVGTGFGYMTGGMF